MNAAPETTTAPKYDGDASKKGRCYVTVWSPDNEEMEQQPTAVNRLIPRCRSCDAESVAEKNGSFMGVVDVEPLKYRCSTGFMVAGGEARSKGVLQTVLGNGPGISIIGKAGQHRLQRRSPELPTVYPYEGEPSVTVVDGPGQNISQ